MPDKKKEKHLIDYVLLLLGIGFVLVGFYLQSTNQLASGHQMTGHDGLGFGRPTHLPSTFFFLLGFPLFASGLFFILFPNKLAEKRSKQKKKE